ncbi:MAG: endonuclease III [Parcubacteria group bacterium]|nr:endonuclease III [Parcubacteria group bacterium]|tara:strand:- start:30054 stop:30869 length:816 start_codon:yes stop_codon:yes gene_type:complete
MEKSKLEHFQKKVFNFYKTEGRHTLPWRNTNDPYCILVSEIMLQQTQVDRVIPKYNEFLRLFPTVKDLSQASLSDVLRIWSGLGYNRRARFLHNAAQEIQKVYNGVMPHTFTELQSLSGIGPYTASAVMVFAFNEPIPMIETNIRSVYIHEFFSRHDEVEDKEIMPYIEKTVDVKNPCIWYAALMDYGTYLKKVTKNPSRKSKHHVIQKAFKGSLREARGKILPLLFKKGKTTAALVKETGIGKKRIIEALEGLIRDGLVEQNGSTWTLCT